MTQIGDEAAAALRGSDVRGGGARVAPRGVVGLPEEEAVLAEQHAMTAHAISPFLLTLATAEMMASCQRIGATVAASAGVSELPQLQKSSFH